MFAFDVFGAFGDLWWSPMFPQENFEIGSLVVGIFSYLQSTKTEQGNKDYELAFSCTGTGKVAIPVLVPVQVQHGPHSPPGIVPIAIPEY